MSFFFRVAQQVPPCKVPECFPILPRQGGQTQPADGQHTVLLGERKWIGFERVLLRFRLCALDSSLESTQAITSPSVANRPPKKAACSPILDCSIKAGAGKLRP